MQLFKHTTFIARPRADVFAYFTDWSKGAEWRQYVKSMEQIDPGPIRPGTRVRFVIELLGEETTYTLTVLTYDPPSLWRHNTGETNYGGYIEYRFDEEQGGTRVTFTCIIKPKTVLGWLAMPQMWLARGKSYRDQLPQLKHALEEAGR
ncbi:MAG TPA: SRPBCC family protein [Gemmatimonadaceae bacterium]|nr:SRPBCC family protein [Gemmatimonadaceae bacterium]